MPLYALMMFFIIYLAKYWSITKVRQRAKEGENDWGTRGRAGAIESSAVDDSLLGGSLVEGSGAPREPVHAKLLDPLDDSTLQIPQLRAPASP